MCVCVGGGGGVDGGRGGWEREVGDHRNICKTPGNQSENRGSDIIIAGKKSTGYRSGAPNSKSPTVS